MEEHKVFIDYLQKFYDRGFLKEVYASDNVIVCNAYNQFYMVFVLKLLEKYEKDFPCFIMNSVGLKEIVRDESFAFTYYGALSDEDQDHALKFLTESVFESWIRRDSELKQRPTAEHMDLAFEEELLTQGTEAVRTRLRAEDPIKKGCFRSF